MLKQAFATSFFLIALTTLQASVTPQKSTTGNSVLYREVCKEAASNEIAFQNFRSMDAYFNSVECGQAGEFAEYIRQHGTTRTMSLISQFRKLDSYGNPVTNFIQGFGAFSGTTLRYVMIADQISRLFDLPHDYTVAEVGAGFGGQAYVLSTLLPFSKYYIYDLPEVEMLIDKMMSTLSLRQVTCLDAYAQLPLDSVDLFISNYALTECDRNTQLDYFERVASKAKRGYILFNNTNIFDHLSLSDIIQLLQTYGIRPKIHPEPVFTYTGNVLITWDRTKQ